MPKLRTAPTDFAHLGLCTLEGSNGRIDDTVYDELRGHFTEDQLVELGVNCAIALGIGRLTATWDVTDDVPDAFRPESDGQVTPWSSAGVIATG